MQTPVRIVAVAAFMLLFSTPSWSQLRNIEEVQFKTSADCPMCKEAIEEMFTFERGVRHAILDLEKNVVTVRYNSRRTDEERLRNALLDLGYKADPVEGEEEEGGEEESRQSP